MMAIFRTSERRMVFDLTGGAAEIVDMGRVGIGGESPIQRRWRAGAKTRNSNTSGAFWVRRKIRRASYSDAATAGDQGCSGKAADDQANRPGLGNSDRSAGPERRLFAETGELHVAVGCSPDGEVEYVHRPVDVAIGTSSGCDALAVSLSPGDVIAGVNRAVSIVVAADAIDVLSCGDVVDMQLPIDRGAAKRRACRLIVADIHHAAIRILAGPARMIEPDRRMPELVQEDSFDVVAVVVNIDRRHILSPGSNLVRPLRADTRHVEDHVAGEGIFEKRTGRSNAESAC